MMMSIQTTSSVKAELKLSSPGTCPIQATELSWGAAPSCQWNQPGMSGKALASVLCQVPHTCQHRSKHRCLLCKHLTNEKQIQAFLAI